METIAKAPTIKSVSTIQELKELIGDKHLVVYTKKDYFAQMDGRKKGGGEWMKFYIISVNKGELQYYSPVSGEMNYMGDMLDLINESFRTPGSAFDNKGTGEEKLFNFFVYNKKRKNTIFLTDSFMPVQLKEEFTALIKEAESYVSQANEIIHKASDNSENYFYPKNRVIPKNAVARRFGDYYGTTYVVKGVRYVFSYDYREYYKMLTADRYFSIKGWCQSSRYFNTYNENYKICNISQKKVNEIHRLYELAIQTQKSFVTRFHDWYKTLSYVCS